MAEVRKSRVGVPAVVYEQWRQELIREEPSSEAWRALLLHLRFDKAMQENAEGFPSANDVYVAVLALADFLNAHEIVRREHLSDPVGRLAHAFVDLHSGRTPDLFRPRPYGQGGRPQSVAEHNTQAIAARAMHELLLAGELDPGSAARRVAAAVRTGRIPRYENCTAKDVRGWLARLRKAEAGTTKVPTALLDRWRAPLPASVGITHRERADFLLTALKQGRGLRWR